MEYFDFENITDYLKEVGTPYQIDSKGTKWFNDTREKLSFLVEQLSSVLKIQLTQNYSEKPNSQAGQNHGFILKHYVIIGCIPEQLSFVDKKIFIKLKIMKQENEVLFVSEVDINSKIKDNPYTKDRGKLRSETTKTYEIDDNFPKNWEDLIKLISHQIKTEVAYLEQYLGMTNIIENYKKHLQENGLADELFKWEILAKYQGRPNLEAENFYEEIRAIDFRNLLFHTSQRVSYHIAKERPEEYRRCFKALFDESILLNDRINTFDEETYRVYQGIVENDKLGHFQDERTIATFLTYYNPNKYTLYKDSFYKKYCTFLGIKPKSRREKYVHYLELVENFINDYILPDTELKELFRSKLPAGCFEDVNYKILAQDILYQTFDKQISIDKPEEDDKQYWIYAPGENAELWKEFYDKGIMALGWDFLGDLNKYSSREEIQEQLQKEEETTKSKKNDTSANIDFKEKVKIGDVIFVKKGRGELLGFGIVNSECFFDDEREYYKNCREVEWQKKGNWKTDHSLVLKTLTDITDYPTENPHFRYYYETLFALMEDKKTENKKLSLNQILFGPPGTGKTYNSIKKAVEIANPKFIKTQWKDIKEEFDRLVENGKVVFTTFHQSMSYEDFIEGIKPETTENGNVNYQVKDGIFKLLCNDAKTPNQSGFEIAYEKLKAELSENELITLKTPRGNEFAISLNSNDNLSLHTGQLKEKQGTLTKENIQKQISGEEKFRGWEGYFNGVVDYLKSKYGYSTNHNSDINNYVLVIDEINRGNVSQIFGELITLIEESKRDGNDETLKITLPYSKEKFCVPSNLYIIGTMNTADRSVEALDTALRRRFSFEEKPPKYDLDQLNYTVGGETANHILATINKRIEKLLDKDHLIGHSFFMKKSNESGVEKMTDAFYKNIIPLLQEYFYGDYGKIGLVLGKDFVNIKSWDNANEMFAAFDYSNDFGEREVFEIIDHRNDNPAFERAIQLLMNKKIG
jgi:5-methylcytosine-specific restriction protein B